MSMGNPPRRKKPCERCNWKYEGFHICFDASKKVPGEGQLEKQKTIIASKPGPARPARPSKATNLPPGQNHYFVLHPSNEERNKELIKFYEENDGGVKAAAKKFHVSITTVNKIIHHFEEVEDRKIMRPRGSNKRYSKAS